MKTKWDFRYVTTLRLNFDLPIGVGSYGHTVGDELENYFTWMYAEYTLQPEIEFKFLQLVNNHLEDINNILITNLKSYSNHKSILLDWRDDSEIEIHNIDPNKFSEEIINQINYEIESCLTMLVIRDFANIIIPSQYQKIMLDAICHHIYDNLEDAWKNSFLHITQITDVIYENSTSNNQHEMSSLLEYISKSNIFLKICQDKNISRG